MLSPVNRCRREQCGGEKGTKGAALEVGEGRAEGGRPTEVFINQQAYICAQYTVTPHCSSACRNLLAHVASCQPRALVTSRPLRHQASHVRPGWSKAKRWGWWTHRLGGGYRTTVSRDERRVALAAVTSPWPPIVDVADAVAAAGARQVREVRHDIAAVRTIHRGAVARFTNAHTQTELTTLSLRTKTTRANTVTVLWKVKATGYTTMRPIRLVLRHIRLIQ